jgi:hypothetical protein
MPMTVYRCNECRARFGFLTLLEAHQIETGHDGQTIEESPVEVVRIAPREPIDRMFAEAAATGFEPLTDGQAQAMREKLREASRAMHGGRR